MKAHEVLHSLSEETANGIFQYLHQNDKPAYRACLNLLASRRKLRPIVLERKTRSERHAWMHAELSRKPNDDAATELLQTWLLGGNQQMVCSFLDRLGIPHDGQGLLDTLPPEPQKERLMEAVDHLLENFPRPAAVSYLNLFSEMDIADWPTLKQILLEDSRLCLATPRLAV